MFYNCGYIYLQLYHIKSIELLSIYYLYRQMHIYIVQNYITNARTCFGALHHLQGAYILKLLKLYKAVGRCMVKSVL